tara:strand:- start:6259 stop:6795 length:537 start_codon:yes stop_codon:yes gene_type:complete
MIIRLKSLLNPLTVADRTVEDFQVHYQETQAYVRSVIYWMVRNQVVDDLVQETYMRAWKSYKRFDGDSSFKTWIYTIAKNVTFDYLKSAKRYEELSEEKLNSLPSHGIDKELEDLITKGLLSLNAEHRECLVLCYKLGHSSAEIAQLLKIPEGTVKSRLFYARDKFSEFLKRNGASYE